MEEALSEFQIAKKIGKWAEDLLSNYFKTNCREIGFDIFEYGSKVIATKRNLTGAGDRPDFIVLPVKFICSLNIDLNKKDLTILNDNDELLRNIVSNAHCFIEMRSSMRYFKQEKYDQEALNFILEEKRIEQLYNWKARVKAKQPVLITWALLDKMYIVSLDKILKYGKIESRTYGRIGREAKVINTYNLPFKKTHFFADIEGAEIIPKKAITKGGYIQAYPLPVGGQLRNVAIQIIRDLITD